MNTNRREFLKFGAGAAAMAAVGGCATADSASAQITKTKFAGLKALPSAMPNAVVKDGKLKGKNAIKYVDDCIWFLRDVARMRPKSVFDTPYLGGFKKIHDATGLKVQFNLFYRNDYFYGMDDFSLSDMPDTYKSELQANADWIKFGIHAWQEFPDYPWVSMSYDDTVKCVTRMRGEITRFAGDNMFARFLLPHWVPMSKEGVKALKDCGINFMCATSGNRYAYNDNMDSLPYGHAFRLLNQRKPETALFTRESNNLAISASICGYNHMPVALSKATVADNKYVYDPDTGMSFHNACTSPMSCLNLQKLKDIPADFAKVNGSNLIGYGNHEQYFFKDYFLYQPDYMEREMTAARLCKENGYSFHFMEELM